MRTSEWVLALVVSVATIALTTAVLIFVDAEFATPGLIYGYLFSVTVVAIYFGSTVAFISALASGAAAAYFLFPPRFTFYISEPRNVAELGFFMLLALIGAKITALLAHDRESKLRRIAPGRN